MSDTRGHGRAISPRAYDVLSRVAGVSDAQWQLVAQAAVGPHATVLEIGSGTGNVLLKVKRAAPEAHVIGLDIDRAALAAAAAKAAAAHQELQLDLGDASRLPYPSGTIDRVLSAFVFHHLAENQRLAMMQEVYRVLKPGGSLHLLDFLERTRRSPAFSAVLSGGRRRVDHQHQSPGANPLALMGRVGLAGPVRVGEGASRLGRHAFMRASR